VVGNTTAIRSKGMVPVTGKKERRRWTGQSEYSQKTKKSLGESTIAWVHQLSGECGGGAETIKIMEVGETRRVLKGRA